jgi:hypothetical protein
MKAEGWGDCFHIVPSSQVKSFVVTKSEQVANANENRNNDGFGIRHGFSRY